MCNLTNLAISTKTSSFPSNSAVIIVPFPYFYLKGLFCFFIADLNCSKNLQDSCLDGQDTFKKNYLQVIMNFVISVVSVPIVTVVTVSTVTILGTVVPVVTVGDCSDSRDSSVGSDCRDSRGL